MASLIKGFRTFFHRYPRTANCLIYGSFYVSAEFSQQHFSRKFLVPKGEEPKPIDWPTIGRYSIVGTIIYPNCLLVWYNWLDKTFLGTSNRIVVQKLILDQFVLTPFMILIFFSSMNILEGKEDILAEFKAKFKDTFLTSCVFWLPAQTVNFKFIQPTWRVVFMGGCAFFWVNVLCWLKRIPMENKNS